MCGCPRYDFLGGWIRTKRHESTMASSWGAAEVPVGDTSVVCFDYTLDGTLCEVCTCFPPPPSRARALNLPAVHLILTSFSRCSKNLFSPL